MQPVVFTSSVVMALMLQIAPPTWARNMAPCSGPNCPLRSTESYGSSRYLLDRWQSVDASGCRCTTCDPSVPCTPGNCQEQHCHDCGPNCSHCSSRLEPRSRMPEPSIGDRTARWGGQLLCPVTGEKLGSMGPAVPVEVRGTTIYVCCEGCVAAVRRAPEKYTERVIRDLASKPAIPSHGASRDRFAPSARVQRLCPVTGEELGSMGRPIPVNVRGRTIYVCCEPCVNAVRRDPDKYLRKVDAERP